MSPRADTHGVGIYAPRGCLRAKGPRSTVSQQNPSNGGGNGDRQTADLVLKNERLGTLRDKVADEREDFLVKPATHVKAQDLKVLPRSCAERKIQRLCRTGLGAFDGACF